MMSPVLPRWEEVSTSRPGSRSDGSAHTTCVPGAWDFTSLLVMLGEEHGQGER